MLKKPPFEVWITGTDAQTRDNITPLTWFKMVQGGLQPHHISGTVMPPPYLDRKKHLLLDRAFAVKRARQDLIQLEALQAAGAAENWMAPFKWQKDTLKASIENLILEIKSLKIYIKTSNPGSWELFEIRSEDREQLLIDMEYQEIFNILGKAIYLDKGNFKEILQKKFEQKKIIKFPNIVVKINTGKHIRWNDIKITFISTEEILIQYGEKHSERKFDNAGFEDRRNGNPIQAWIALCEVARQNRGMFKYSFKTRNQIEKVVQILNKKFHMLFPDIDGKPFDLFKRESAYKLAFQISSNI